MDSTISEVVGIGVATRDHLLRVAAFPEAEGVTQVIESIHQGGGPVATALCVLGHLGQRCLLVDQFTDDDIGNATRLELQGFGVDLAPSRSVAGRSAAATVLVREDDGARHILFRPGEAAELSGADVKREWFAEARLLHINGRHADAARAAIPFARDQGARVSFDGGAGRYRDEIRDLAEASDIRILARDFAEKWSGCSDVKAMGPALMSGVAELVAVTDGLAGSWIWSRSGESFHQPAIISGRTVDTTGCGDVYHGAFLHGLLEGWPLRRCAAFASELAGKNALGLGGRYALRVSR